MTMTSPPQVENLRAPITSELHETLKALKVHEATTRASAHLSRAALAEWISVRLAIEGALGMANSFDVKGLDEMIQDWVNDLFLVRHRGH